MGFPKQVKSVTQWVEMLVSGLCAHFARYNRTRLGDQSFLLLLACGYAPSKLTNQVEAAVVKLAKLRKKNTDLDCGKSSVDALRVFTGIEGNPTSSWGVELVASI